MLVVVTERLVGVSLLKLVIATPTVTAGVA